MAEQKTEQPAAAPKSNLDAMNEAFAEALKAEGVVKTDSPSVPPSPPTEAPKEAQPPAAAEPPKETPAPAPAPAPEKSWEKLMAEKAELRRQQEALRANPSVALQGKLDPGSVQALVKAKESGDPLGALAALGFSYGDITKQLLASPEAPPAQKQQQKEADPEPARVPAELQARLQRLDQLEAWALQQQRKEILSQVKASIPADKFKLISGREDYERVLGFLEHFHSQTGSLPADNFSESVLVAAEALERQLSQEAERWKRVLTPAPAAATIQTEAQRESPPQSGQVTPVHKTLTNQVAAPATTQPEPKTRDEVIASLLKDPEFLKTL